jgi:hypothetical protein
VLSQCPRELWVSQKSHQTFREANVVIDWYKHPVPGRELWDTADRRAHERTPSAHRLGEYHRHALCSRWQGNHPRRTQQISDCLGANRRTDVEALGLWWTEVPDGSHHDASSLWTRGGYSRPCTAEHIGALPHPDLAGEDNQLLGLIGTRRAVIHRHRIGHQLGSGPRQASSYKVENAPIEASYEMSTSQHTDYKPWISPGEG